MTPTPDINGGNRNDVALRDYVEALFAERERQLIVASVEREKAAAALRAADSNAMQQAEREREKAANAMRIALDRSINEGDDRLREHIANQVMQINAALESAEKLEVQRMKGGEEGTRALRREMELITAAAKEAILKAEEAQKDVNLKSNEFRGQLSDQAANLMPRRESESRTGELDRRIEEARAERGHQIDALNNRVAQVEQGRFGDARAQATSERQQDRIQPWQIWLAGAVLALIVLLSNNVFG